MMDAMELLLGRNSAPRLIEPAPSGDDLERIFQAAMRAPDHARLRPWRFLQIEGEARGELGDLYAGALRHRKPEVTEVELQKAHRKALRAPLMIVVVVCFSEHPKVPHQEQLLSAGCAAHAMMLACHALGYAGVWRTGDNAFDDVVARGLSLGENEAIVGFLYMGSIDGNYKPLPSMESSEYVTQWGSS